MTLRYWILGVFMHLCLPEFRWRMETFLKRLFIPKAPLAENNAEAVSSLTDSQRKVQNSCRNWQKMNWSHLLDGHCSPWFLPPSPCVGAILCKAQTKLPVLSCKAKLSTTAHAPLWTPFVFTDLQLITQLLQGRGRALIVSARFVPSACTFPLPLHHGFCDKPTTKGTNMLVSFVTRTAGARHLS